MATENPTPPRWIIVRLGADSNWWIQQTCTDVHPESRARGVLDPRQIAHLVEALDAYRPYGYRRQMFANAFHVFAVEAEIADGSLRLAPSDESIFETGAQLFALPVIEDDAAGAYYDLLDAVSSLRIRKLNATHHYARNCTEFDMYEELQAIDQDRYFSDESIHVFDEINEILEWSPAEWDDSEQL